MVAAIPLLKELLQGLKYNFETVADNVGQIINSGIGKEEKAELKEFFRTFDNQTFIISGDIEQSLDLVKTLLAELGEFKEDNETEGIGKDKLNPEDKDYLDIIESGKYGKFESPTFDALSEKILEEYEDLRHDFNVWKITLDESVQNLDKVIEDGVKNSIEAANDMLVLLDDILSIIKKVNTKIEIFIDSLE